MTYHSTDGKRTNRTLRPLPSDCGQAFPQTTKLFKFFSKTSTYNKIVQHVIKDHSKLFSNNEKIAVILSIIMKSSVKSTLIRIITKQYGVRGFSLKNNGVRRKIRNWEKNPQRIISRELKIRFTIKNLVDVHRLNYQSLSLNTV